MIITKGKKRESVVERYEKPRLGSGAYKQEKLEERRRSEFQAYD
jgi:hypothetical protein